MSFDALLSNSSPKIHKIVVDKLFKFITNNTLEIKIAGLS